MDLKNRKAYMDAICERYHKAPIESKTRILNELCEVCGYNRKYAIWKISHWRASRCLWEFHCGGRVGSSKNADMGEHSLSSSNS